MGNINDMITNIAQGDLAKAQADFNDVMGDKVAARLDQHQTLVATETFSPSDDEDEDYDDLFDESESDDEDYEGEYDLDEEGDEDLLDGEEEDE